jgi:hypothetical protein
VYFALAIERIGWLSLIARGFHISRPAPGAYDPACEEDECGMEGEAGLDNAGPETGEPDAAGRDKAGVSDAGVSDAGSGRRGAADIPDPANLAQDWITLWQSELSAMAADPEIRESWQVIMAMWAGAMASMLRGVPRDPNVSCHDGARGRSRPADAPRPPPPAAAPDSRDAEIERLARHVTALERRLAELERGGNPSVHPKVRPGRKRRR